MFAVHQWFTGKLTPPGHGLCLILGVLALWLGAVPGRAQEPVQVAFVRAAAQAGGARNAEVRLIRDNTEAWYARWTLLSAAKSRIDASYFHAEPDPFALAFLGRLLERARQGITVRLMLDFRGARGLIGAPLGQQYLRDLTATGHAQVKVFNPYFKAIFLALSDPRHVMSSTHQKFLIVDGQWMLTGGRNLTADYFASPLDRPTAFRDTDVLIRDQGTAAAATRAFDRQWNQRSLWSLRPGLLDRFSERSDELAGLARSMDRFLESSARIPDVPSELSPYAHLTGFPAFRLEGDGPTGAVALLHKSALVQGAYDTITPSLERLFDAARNTIDIENAYVILTPRARAAFRRAALRGVKITLLTNSPDSSNQPLTQVALVHEWKELLRDIPGMRLLLTRRRLLHSKVFVFDGRVTVLGSYNLDPLSEAINSEDVIAVDSLDFGRQCVDALVSQRQDALECKIRMEQDGSLVEVVGPKMISSVSTQRQLGWMSWLLFLRPLM